MEVKICKNCKRLFSYIYGSELCPDCIGLLPKEERLSSSTNLTKRLSPVLAEEEEKYRQVKDYVMLHPKATVVQISEANGIPPKKIFEWIREDRMEFSEDSEFAWFECLKCGKKIKSGTLCNRCK